jgi:hypothetical protein
MEVRGLVWALCGMDHHFPVHDEDHVLDSVYHVGTDVMQHDLTCYEQACCLHLLVSCLAFSSTMKMEVVYSFKM